ncbi:hypothetical protein [Paenarthrobacter nitroguajacolicus]|uniref:hypothetical protein n=1 Tax=Paenarthrobacter nitroguajacolicus TaxID=211146 RepID=UPI00248C7714|nr:hypothetical protein [Paenarthrobacter nitroguajacolicus]
MAWIGSILWTAIDEGAVPDDSSFLAIPSPSEAGAVSTRCGSGGCSRIMTVNVKPPQAPQSLAAEMGLTQERCEPMNLWTMRRTCTGVSGDARGLQIYLQYSPFFSKY